MSDWTCLTNLSEIREQKLRNHIIIRKSGAISRALSKKKKIMNAENQVRQWTQNSKYKVNVK